MDIRTLASIQAIGLHKDTRQALDGPSFEMAGVPRDDDGSDQAFPPPIAALVSAHVGSLVSKRTL